MMQFNFNILFEFLSLFAAISQYRKLRGSYMVYFIPFLAMVITVEMLAKWNVIQINGSNMVLYNVPHTIMFLFYTWILAKLTSNKKQRLVSFILVATLLTIHVIYHTVTHQWGGFIPLLFTFASLLLVIFSCMYFYHYLKSDYQASDKEHLGGLWIAAGLLIFYSGIFVVYSLNKYIIALDLRVYNLRLHKFIPRMLSIPLYSCFIVSFLIWKPNPARK